jgi:hypothetical protein
VEAILSVSGGLAALIALYWLGFYTGRRYRKLKRWHLRVAYVVPVVVGAVVCAVGAQARQTWVWVTGLCIMGGGLSGLRHGRKRGDRDRKDAIRAAAAEKSDGAVADVAP